MKEYFGKNYDLMKFRRPAGEITIKLLKLSQNFEWKHMNSSLNFESIGSIFSMGNSTKKMNTNLKKKEGKKIL